MNHEAADSGVLRRASADRVDGRRRVTDPGVGVARYGFEPANLVIAVITERHADNRILRVVAESENFVTSSDRSLDGEDSPRFARFEFREVPAGAYDIRATLIGPDGNTRAVADVTATVISRDGY